MNIEVFGCSFCGVAGLLCGGGAEDFGTLKSIMDHSELEKISKALADETRLRIFEAISASDRISCGDIVSMRGVTPATVSHHLKVLNEAGLISCQREGQFIYNQAVPGTIEAYTRALSKIAKGTKPGRRR